MYSSSGNKGVTPTHFTFLIGPSASARRSSRPLTSRLQSTTGAPEPQGDSRSLAKLPCAFCCIGSAKPAARRRRHLVHNVKGVGVSRVPSAGIRDGCSFERLFPRSPIGRLAFPGGPEVPGTARNQEMLRRENRSLQARDPGRDETRASFAPAGLSFSGPSGPTVETVGYCRSSRRDLPRSLMSSVLRLPSSGSPSRGWRSCIFSLGLVSPGGTRVYDTHNNANWLIFYC